MMIPPPLCQASKMCACERVRILLFLFAISLGMNVAISVVNWLPGTRKGSDHCPENATNHGSLEHALEWIVLQPYGWWILSLSFEKIADCFVWSYGRELPSHSRNFLFTLHDSKWKMIFWKWMAEYALDSTLILIVYTHFSLYEQGLEEGCKQRLQHPRISLKQRGQYWLSNHTVTFIRIHRGNHSWWYLVEHHVVVSG